MRIWLLVLILGVSLFFPIYYIDPSFTMNTVSVYYLGGFILVEVLLFVIAKKTESRRSHQSILIEKSFIKWREAAKSKVVHSNPLDRTELGVIDYLDDKVHRVDPSEPNNLKYYKQVKSHLTSGYKSIWKIWMQAKEAALKFNQQSEEILKSIEVKVDLITSKFKFKDWNNKGQIPKKYIHRNGIIRKVYQEANYFSVNGRLSGYLTIFPVDGEWKTFKLSDQSAVSRNETELRSFALDLNELAKELAESKTFKLLKGHRKDADKKTVKFNEKLDGIIESFELGKSLKGKCKDCT